MHARAAGSSPGRPRAPAAGKACDNRFAPPPDFAVNENGTSCRRLPRLTVDLLRRAVAGHHAAGDGGDRLAGHEGAATEGLRKKTREAKGREMGKV